MTLTMEQEQLVLDNTKLVHFFAHRYDYENHTHDDLVSLGTIGLIKACKKYDSEKGYAFSTYAALFIRGEITKPFRKKRVQAASLDEIIKGSEDTERVDLISSDLSIEHEVQMKLDISQSLNLLNDRERFVVIRRFGLFGNEPLSQPKTGKLLGVSQVQVSRIERAALTKLRKFFVN